MEGVYGELTAPVQRATATILLRAEVKLDTCAQLSEAGSDRIRRFLTKR